MKEVWRFRGPDGHTVDVRGDLPMTRASMIVHQYLRSVRKPYGQHWRHVANRMSKTYRRSP